MATNIIVATFCTDQTRAWTDELWQYDYGQILKFDGLELPDAYEVHFSNQPLSGETITQIGTADGVTIPDQFLQSGKVVYAWVYLHAGEDDGETEYMVTIPVSKRPEPSDEQPTPVEQSAIDQAIAALNIAVEKADEAITHYPKIESGTWWVWDVTEEEWVDTEVEARGPQGIQGIPGQDGEDGAPGAPGEDGFSPEIAVQDITGGHRITITDATGTSTVDVMDGEDGQPGQPGQPGATGNGIASIVKTGTAGLVDTYTITYTNGTTTTFTVTNGSDATVTVDDELSSTSENPVQNKVINGALSGLSDDLNHKVSDVKINGTSIVDENNEADIPIASANELGVSKVDGSGLNIVNGQIMIARSSSAEIKAGTNEYKPTVPTNQHESVFYGLAKAASDTTQSSSSNPVGTYTDDAKVKIQKMLGVYNEWELINEVTVSEDSATVTINTDSNGSPFKLKKIYVRIWAKPSTTGSNSSVYTRILYERKDGTSGSDNSLSGVSIQTSNRYIDYIVENVAGFLSCMMRNGSTTGNTSNWQGACGGSSATIKAITGFELFQSSSTTTLIPQDTIIHIFGIKA